MKLKNEKCTRNNKKDRQLDRKINSYLEGKPKERWTIVSKTKKYKRLIERKL